MCVFSLSVFMDLFVFRYAIMGLWKHHKCLADSISYLNRNNEELILMNIHNIIESSIDGHSPVIKNEQLIVFNEGFINNYHAVSSNEDLNLDSFIFFSFKIIISFVYTSKFLLNSTRHFYFEYRLNYFIN